MTQSDPPRLPSAWLRAIGFATSAPDGPEALAGILAEAVPSAGADAGAVVDAEGLTCRGAWGFDPAEVEALLEEGGAVRQTLGRREAWDEDELRVDPPPGSSIGGAPVESGLLIPLRVRGMPTGALLLLYRPGARPSAVQRQSSLAFAGLLALVMESDRLFEESRHAQQARDHFLVALNHELRTPASALMLTADLLRSGAYGTLPERLDDALRETEDHLQAMVGVLRRVLDLGGLEGQAVPERADLLQPRQAVTELLRRVEPAAKRKQLTLTLYVPRTLPPLQTDAARFSRILLYLLSNAIKYTTHGGIEVRIERSTRLRTPGRQEPILVVRVKDTGRGIPPEELARIFEPFTQVDEGARTDSRNRGLGLGLPLARQLARSLGGDIAVESSPGHGTVASVFIPYNQGVTG